MRALFDVMEIERNEIAVLNIERTLQYGLNERY